MSSTIDRVHYYERQYLRSHDLTAEQLYHMEMRRRLNLALHLWGIVDGLDLRESPPTPGLPKSFFISRGMALDVFGREVLLPYDYPLTAEDLERNRIRFPLRTYFLSIGYRRDLATPPSGGYRVCDLKDQYTRWRESFELLITETDPTPQTSSPPGVAEALSDDPVANPWPIVLGTVKTDYDSDGKLTITLATSELRTYAGVRAQRIITPASSVTSNPAQTLLPFAIKADVLAEQNAFVGSNFEIKNASGNPAPDDPTAANPRGKGVLKVADDMFLDGEFYANVGGEWLTMKDYLQSFIPEIQVGRAVVPVTPLVSPTSSGTEQIQVTLKRLRKPKEQLLMAAISSITWQSRQQADVWDNDNTQISSPIKLSVSDAVATEVSPTSYRFDVAWAVEPTSLTPVNVLNVPIREFTLSWVAVFNP